MPRDALTTYVVCSGSTSQARVVMSAASKRRATESGLNGEMGGGRGAYKKAAPGNESNLNPEEMLQQAVLRLDSVKACACPPPHPPPRAGTRLHHSAVCPRTCESVAVCVARLRLASVAGAAHARAHAWR